MWHERKGVLSISQNAALLGLFLTQPSVGFTKNGLKREISSGWQFSG